jgi:hypothetical protein
MKKHKADFYLYFIILVIELFVVVSLTQQKIVEMFYKFLLSEEFEDWAWYTLFYINKDICIILGILKFKRNKDILSSFSKLGDQAHISDVFYPKCKINIR